MCSAKIEKIKDRNVVMLDHITSNADLAPDTASWMILQGEIHSVLCN